ncbi:MAG: amino acid adenylation domain-containing protein, partial [Ignavibacteriae bacterium]|nr:amino acid adenylation domain-containing protein [Ignavibacteriota bacterium]
EQLLEAEQLYEIIISENIDIAEFVPAVLRNLIEYIDKKTLKLDTFKVLIAGSDIWYVKEYNEFKKYCSKDVRLINSFGLTEAAIDSTYFEDDNLNISDERLVPIGKPFPNIQLYILDPNLITLPIGVKGELYIGGISLARGYYKRADLTAERFLPNLYSKTKGDRLYKTGDVARYLPDGNIEFLCRADHQIKLRGFRIELGEIENALSESEQVKDAIVIAREDNVGDKRIVAYVIFENGSIIDSNNLRVFVAERVPDYMIPSAFVVLNEFPLTPNGKVDRKSLPEPDQIEIQKSFEVDYVAPRNEVQEIIVKIWQEILRIESVGIFHNFFILGGHSLLATQVISRIKSELKVTIPLRFIFEKPTVEALAEEVEKLKLTSNELTDTKILPRENVTDISLSFAQERLWFLDQLEPNSPFYNIPESYRLKGEIDFTILQKCFNDISNRHEILRTYFTSSDGTPSQIIQGSLEIEMPIIDLSLKSESERERESERIISEETKTPISINELPLFRIKIIKLSDDDHVFLMTIHHIISDDWSTKVIVQELGVLYESYIKRMNPPIVELSIQYADYSIWQREWLKGKVLESHIDYWKNKLSGVPSLLELPTDYPRPKTQTFNGDFTSFKLSDEVSKQLSLLSKEEGATVFMVLLAAFKILLFKLSGQNDICIGTPSANRNREEIESLIGFFVNTLTIRTDCSNNPSFKELIGRIKESTLGAYAHQDLPFEYIVDAVKPERNLSHSPIFQVMFVYQNVEGKSEERNTKLSIEPVESHSKTSKFDLTLFMVDSGDEVGGAFEYNTDLFTKSTIDNFIEYFTFILNEGLKDKSKSISNLKLLNRNDQNKIIDRLNGNVEMGSLNNLVPTEFSKVAQLNAQKIAVEFKNEKYSFEKLEKDSNKISNYLIKIGITKEQIVGICLPRSYNLITSLLGILKAGAAYLPIDLKYPQERIDYILQDSGARFVITEKKYQSLFNESTINSVILDSSSDNINNESSGLPKVDLDKNNLCYVIYTSGSTGKPKGALITHGGLLNYLSWTHHAYPFNQENGSLVHSTVSFDATVTSIFPSLLLGKKIVLMEETDELDEPTKVIDANEKFSIIKITPAHLELLSNLTDEKKANEIADAMIIGGENLTVKQTEYWQEHAPNTLLFNEYGPTEAVVGCVVYEGSKYDGNGSVPIGKVIPNMKVYVLDANLSQVPNGVIGELYIGGVSLARGYLNKPNLTAEKFIPNPFADDRGERIYRTGDLVKILNDGNLIFIGRIDDQVKVRGYRIELGEIETKINQIDEILESVVDIKDFGENDKRILAYIIQGEKRIEVSVILNALRLELPEYMLPSSIIEIDEIPLTINGKVDRKKLQLPSEDLRKRDAEIVEPSTETEKAIHRIWAEVLKNQNISVYDNFFDLGGHSLLVTKLVVRIGKYFEITCPIKDVFEFPTIAQISSEIDSGKYHKKSSSLPSIKKYNEKESIPLSFTQRRLWFLDQLDPGQSIYNMPMAMKINGNVDLSIIEKTIDYLADRHETLRTNIIEVNGIPQQIIQKNHNILIRVDKLGEFNNSEQNLEVNKIKQEEASHPFNLETDSLIRFRTAILSDNQFVIFFTMHHIISDGWSVNILLEEFVQSYLALVEKTKPKLPDLSIQYSDFSIWQQQYLVGEVLNKQINYWTTKLEDQPNLLELPLDKQRPINKTFNGSHFSFDIDKETIEHIDEILKTFKITPFMFLIGTFQILLSRLSNQSDISVGTPVANRTQIETEKIIGFFANTLVMRNHVDSNKTISEFFDQVKETALESYENQDVPFEKLVEILKPERDLGHTPLFQIMFVLQNNEEPTSNESDTFVVPLESESSSTQYDLTLSMSTSSNNWSGTLEYNTDLFEIDTIKSIVKSYQKLVADIVSEQKTLIYELEYLSDDEKQNLIGISKGKIQENSFSNVLDKFESIVNKYPINTACEFEDKTLVFKDLDDRSNKVCTYLVEQGFETEDVIGIMLPSCLELPEWILGIMKAGCCYMPIDPNYPTERIEYMIKDSGVKAILYNQDSSKLNSIDSNIKTMNLGLTVEEISKFNYVQQKEIRKKSLAYLIYTSGSTGKPKGVMLEHEGLINLVTNQIKDFKVTEKSKVLQFASISFDASISEMFMSLLSGANLILVNREILTNPIEVKNILLNKNISVVTLPPSLMQVMDDEDLVDLKTVVSAGEKLNKEVANKWSHDRALINAYGPTEATVGVSSFEIKKTEDVWNSVPIGSAINNVNLFVLDVNLNLVKKGTIGEIFIGGISLARGYKSQPNLTAEKFVPNPYATIQGERLYRTGDLGRFTKNGVIEYVGRIDEQVKVRGFRIELTEIEIVLKSLPNIDEAVVVTQGDGEKAKLVAFVKIVDKNKFNLDLIIKKVNDKLPDFMVPGIILEIDEIPITPNGKIDRKKMPKLGELEDISVRKYIAPSNEYEKKLVLIWKELLGIKKIGVNDNFFELGGHSLLITQLVSRINDVFEIDLQLKDLFSFVNIRMQASHIELKQKTGHSRKNKITKAKRPAHIPLSFAQQRLWVLDKIETEHAVYNIPTSLKLIGKINFDNIEKSLMHLIERHESLRTNFYEIDHVPYQSIHNSSEKVFKINFIDVSELQEEK